MYKAIRTINSSTGRKPLVIDTGEGITANPKQQTDTVTAFFQTMFSEKDIAELPNIPPREMKVKFREEEIKKAVQTLKNNKSAGIDNIKAEQLKHGPDVVYQQIADILNITARTGEYPNEIKQGILVPLQKPGKARGPVANLRPIVLLSVLRNILAICMIKRIGHKINESIPVSQAAYRAGRSTTEQIFTIKLLAEKAIASTDYTTKILLMDMSKAFDTIRRDRVIEDLRDILDPAELHMIKVLLNDVNLTVRIKDQMGQPFGTNKGTPQGDCLSPVLFTLYLSKALRGEPTSMPQELNDHTYSQDPGECVKSDTMNQLELRDHNYCQDPNAARTTGTLISLQYADDICWVGGNCGSEVDKQKLIVPPRLQARNLSINTSKPEEYLINHQETDGDWKTCRYLGSLLDTTKDLARRKSLAMVAYRKLKEIFEDRRLHVDHKTRIFNALVASIFLYNCEIWTPKKATYPEIDAFQRKLLRYMLNIRWPQKISNEEVYSRTSQTRWSERVQTRRMRWFGHMARLPDQAPVRLALEEFQRDNTRRPRGGQRITWIKTIKNDLKHIGLTLEQALETATDRVSWRSVVAGIGG